MSQALLLFRHSQDSLHVLLIKDFLLLVFLGLSINSHHDSYTLLWRKSNFYELVAFHESDDFPLVKAAFDEKFDSVRSKMVT